MIPAPHLVTVEAYCLIGERYAESTDIDEDAMSALAACGPDDIPADLLEHIVTWYQSTAEHAAALDDFATGVRDLRTLTPKEAA